MQCSGCGKPLTDGVSVCLHCGTPIPREYAATGVAIAANGRQANELFSGEPWPALSAPTSPYGREFSSFPPPPPPPNYLGTAYTESTYPITHNAPQHVARRTLVAIAAVLSLVIGIFGTYRFVFAKNTLQNQSTSQSDGRLGNLPTPLDQQRCTPAHIDTTATIVRDPQLTSGLKDLQAGNYTPIDAVDTFQVGKTAYLTFVVGTLTGSGTLVADWCLGTSSLLAYKQIVITSSQAGVKGYFSVSNIDRRAIGPSKIVLWWQPTDPGGAEREAAILSLPFTIADVSSARH